MSSKKSTKDNSKAKKSRRYLSESGESKGIVIIIILAWISITFFAIYLFRASTNFYDNLDEGMQQNIAFDVESLANNRIEHIEEALDGFVTD